MRTKVIAKVVVVGPDGKVLLLRRSRDDRNRPGEPDFPGGGVEYGEDMTVAVCREASEEAGLQIAAAHMHLFYAHTEMAKHGNVVRLVYTTSLRTPTEIILSDEHDAYEWVDPSDVSQLFRHPVYGASVDYARKHDLFYRMQR